MLLASISDRLCIRLYYGSNPRFQEQAKKHFEEAIKQLKDIRNGDLDIYELDRAVSHLDDLIVTGRIDSDFDPERDPDDMTVNPSWILPDTRELENY